MLTRGGKPVSYILLLQAHRVKDHGDDVCNALDNNSDDQITSMLLLSSDGGGG